MENFIPLAVYAFVSSITPGPNNMMLTASGISFGFQKTLPHLFGIPFGFGVQLAMCAYGLGAILIYLPMANLALKLFGTVYLIYLAWMLRSNIIRNQPNSMAKPMTFINAALFQFANPKAWIMAMTGASVFIPQVQPYSFAVGLLCLVFYLITLPCIGVWALLGSSIKHYLHYPVWQKGFSSVIVLLTLYTVVAIWL